MEVLNRKLKVKNNMWRIIEKNQRQLSNWVGLLQDFLSVVYWMLYNWISVENLLAMRLQRRCIMGRTNTSRVTSKRLPSSIQLIKSLTCCWISWGLVNFILVLLNCSICKTISTTTNENSFLFYKSED